MHFVTKVLVVFATILSVFLSALVISYAVNNDRVAKDYSNLMAEKQALLGSQQALAVENGNLRREKEGWENNSKAAIAEAKNRNVELETRLTENLRNISTLRDSSDKAQALATQLSTTNSTQAALIESLRKDADDSRSKQVETARRNAELEKALADLRRSYEAAENEKKLVREQLAEAKSQLDALRASGGNMSAASAAEPFVYTGPTISGKVEELTTDTAGSTLAKISVGSNDNIRENMKLAIRRNNEFVGNLVIVRTDLKHAIGRIDLLGRDVKVQVGDTVQSNIQ